MNSLNEIWNLVKQQLADEVSAVSFDSWIKPIEPVSADDTKFTLKVSSGLNKNMIMSKYFSLIEENGVFQALKTVFPLESNRLLADDFVKELKDVLLIKVKENISFKESQKEYLMMYDIVCDMESLLVTNINLSLFFTSLTSRLMSIKN